MAFNPVAVILRATQIARGWGLTVTFEPGWETRGNGYRPAWVGFLLHHTGSNSSDTNPFPSRRLLRDGRSDLPGPLCNSGGPRDGSIHVMAAQAANHAGATGTKSKSRGPFPATTLFNPLVFGHEVDYPGSSPMATVQYVAAVLWGRAVLLALVEAGQISRFDAERARLHYETSITGKWDAGVQSGIPIDAAAYRRAVATQPNTEDAVPISEVMFDALAYRADALASGSEVARGGPARGEPIWLVRKLNAVAAQLDALTKAVAAAIADPDIDQATIARLLDESVARHTPTAEQTAAALVPLVESITKQVLGADNADQAREILAQLRAALPESENS